MLRPNSEELFAQASTAIALVQQVTGVAADGQTVPVDERIKIVMGQDYLHPPAGQRWQMSNNALYEAVSMLSSQVQVLTDLLAATRDYGFDR